MAVASGIPSTGEGEGGGSGVQGSLDCGESKNSLCYSMICSKHNKMKLSVVARSSLLGLSQEAKGGGISICACQSRLQKEHKTLRITKIKHTRQL